MKKYVFCLLALFIPYIVHSQFVLTTEGVVNNEDSTKNYVICEFDGKKKEELYTSVLKYITNTYVSPKDVISKVEGETISLKGVKTDGILYGDFKGKPTRSYDLFYVVVFNFKDSKIKVDVHMDKNVVKDNMGRVKGYLIQPTKDSFFTANTFDKKGKIIDEKSKKSIESFFNNIVSSLKDYINRENDW